MLPRLLRFIIVCCFVNTLYGQTHAEVLEEAITYEIRKNKLVTKRSVTLQTNDRLGESLGDISIFFQKDRCEIKKLKVEILNSSGEIIRALDKSEYKTTQRFGYSFYSDFFLLHFNVRHNTYPYRIRYSYQSKEEEYLHIANWNPFYDIAVPVHKSSLTIIAPSDFDLKIEEKNITHTKTVAGNEKILHWTTSIKEAPKRETWSYPISSYYPNVRVVPQNFFYGVEGDFESWTGFSRWFHNLNRSALDLPESEIAYARSLTDTLEGNREKVQVLYNYLQDNTRYINISVEDGGMKSQPASYACKMKYGDCKALTTYMKALLLAIEIPSNYVLVYGDYRSIPLNPSFPSSPFNHVILAVPLEKDTIWLENTSNSHPFNYLGTFTQNRKGLFIDSTNGGLINLPALPINEVKQYRCVEINTTSDESSAKLNYTATLYGPSSEHFRSFIKNNSKEESVEELEELINMPDFELDDFSVKIPDKGKAMVLINGTGTLEKYPKRYGVTSIYEYSSLGIPRFENPEERTQPVIISYPVALTDTIKIGIDGSHDPSLPSPWEISSEFGHYSYDFRKEDARVVLIRQFVLKRGVITVDQYPGFYNFLESISMADKQLNFSTQPN